MVNAFALSPKIVRTGSGVCNGPAGSFRSRWTSPMFMKSWQGMSAYASKHGWLEAIRWIRVTNEINFNYGKLKGVDRFGNRYYENPDAIARRTRFVVFGEKRAWSACDVPSEWHSWLHQMCDETPVEKPPPLLPYKLVHLPRENSVMASNASYVPPGHYNNKLHQPDAISKPRYEAWSPN
mmetsp:Transcript_21801/g.30806  ORF Transcript_21801/g.30806 Transcript_21801/m.30806 type:complete len:180 (-) Transcript_21801:257-796(-)